MDFTVRLYKNPGDRLNEISHPGVGAGSTLKDALMAILFCKSTGLSRCLMEQETFRIKRRTGME